MNSQDEGNSGIDSRDSLDWEADTYRYIEDREAETRELQYKLQDIIENEITNWDEQHPSSQ